MSVTKQRKQVVLLYISTLTGVVLGMLSSIVNTHFMSPSDYGDVRYVQNIINFIASFLLFGYFLSGARLMALSNHAFYSRRIKAVMVIILLLACAVLAIAMIVCSLIHYKSNPTIALLFIISLPVCFYPLLLNYTEQTTIGDNQIGRLAMARLFPFLVYVPLAYIVYSNIGASSIKMILLQWGIYSIIYVCIIVSTRPLFKRLHPIWNALQRENNKYGIQLYIGSLVMVATNYLAGISLGYFNDENTEVGFYTLALTVTAPLAYLPTIVGNTYFKKFASQPRIPTNIIVFTVVLTFISCILFLLIIKPMVLFLYSESYAIVGRYASFLSIGFCIHGLGDMFNRYLCSHAQGKSVRNASVINGIVKVIGYTALVAWLNTSGAILTTIICDVVYFSCLIYYYMRFVKRNRS